MSKSVMKAACVQMTSSANIEENLTKAGSYIRQAALQGADFVATPENTCHMIFPLSKKRDITPKAQEHPGVNYFSKVAKELGITILAGSIAVRNEEDKMLNRSYLFGSDGKVISKYDKIHLFDANIGQGEVYKESDVITSGNEAVIARINEHFVAGMSVCYDLRFAHLYRDLAKAGANLMCIPSAFTMPTGRAHWEILLRARAIETGSFVIAPGQVGEHEGGRKTYGHSMIISPWGRILAHQEEGEGIIIADLDATEVQTSRAALPALTHDREYSIIKC
ncbi:MAG: carbon-nitrogen hydrolase family protein [Alphaproteobacteria bacterium]